MGKDLHLGTLIQDLKRDIMTTEWQDDFAPPEGRPGYSGPDVTTELQGFKYDALSVIVGPFEKLRDESLFNPRVDSDQVGEMLTKIANDQRSNSAGPFIRYLATDFRNRLCPGYQVAGRGAVSVSVAAASETPSSREINLEEVFTKVMQDIRNPETTHTEILNSVRAKFNASTVTEDSLIRALKDIGDAACKSGDDNAAYISDELRVTAKRVLSPGAAR